MTDRRIYQQGIEIKAKSSEVERCIVDLSLMHRWLNPALRCEPLGEWNTSVGGKSRFIIQVPFWQPTLTSTVVERDAGLIVWGFEGFFCGQDRWECQPISAGTYLLNRFEFEIVNPIVRTGFDFFAASWTQKDMQAQLKRLKQVAENLESSC